MKPIPYKIIGLGQFACWLFCLGLLACYAPQTRAQKAVETETTKAENAEKRVFEVAQRFFRNASYDLAVEKLEAFAVQFPNSPNRPMAVLLAAQSRFQIGQNESAVSTLRDGLAKAGPLADLFLFWIGEGLFRLEEFENATTTFTTLLENHPTTPRRLEAALTMARARYHLGDLKKVIGILEPVDGPFQKAAGEKPKKPEVIDGRLLLARVYFEMEEHGAARLVLEGLEDDGLAQDAIWRRHHLLARVHLAEAKLELAFKGATNLVAAAGKIQDAEFSAKSVALHAEVLRAMKQPDASAKVYEQNLQEGVPETWRRAALLQIVDLQIRENRLSDAIQQLDTFFASHPNDPATDLAHLTMGELRLRKFYGLGEAESKKATNLLSQAVGHFDALIQSHSGSPLIGKSWLDRGWCLWEWRRISGQPVQLTAARQAFYAASSQLRDPTNLSVARFKLADCLFQEKDYIAASSNYWTAIGLATNTFGLNHTLVDQALYQLVRSGIQRVDMADAGLAVSNILSWYPDSFYSDRSLLIYGQAVNRQGKPADARRMFSSFIEKFPRSPLIPEASLAVARTHVMEGSWIASILEYDHWVTNYPGHASIPRAEFDRAWLNSQAGNDARAFQLYTNFVTRFPKNRLAPQAQHWVADHHFRKGDFLTAEQNYQRLFQNTNWLKDELAIQGRLMAGRAAFSQRNHKQAENWFWSVITNKLAPPPLAAQAEFFLADTLADQSEIAPTNFIRALKVFNSIIIKNQGSPLRPQVLGRIGDCHFQLGQLDDAEKTWSQVIGLPEATVTVRSQADTGLARIQELKADKLSGSEKETLLLSALKQYQELVYGGNLRSANETADPFWVKEAGLAAGRLAEQLERWNEAAQLYAELSTAFPNMPVWTNRLQQIRNRPELAQKQ